MRNSIKELEVVTLLHKKIYFFMYYCFLWDYPELELLRLQEEQKADVGRIVRVTV